MIVYCGRTVIITLDDGSAVRGRLGWPWTRGHLRILAAESLDGDTPQSIPGQLLIPRSRVLIAQVL